MKYDVFISYSRKDTPIADRICEAFDRAGITYFIDRQGIAGGMEFPQVLADAIEESTLFLFLASENSYQSKFTNNEILYAFNEKSTNSLLPYVIDGSRLPKQLRFSFASINVRNIEEHPIEPVLVDDIIHLLAHGRNEGAFQAIKTARIMQEIYSDEVYRQKGFVILGEGESVLSDEEVSKLDLDGKKVKISDSVKVLQKKNLGIFHGSKLVSVVIPNTIEVIPSCTFWNCENLNSIIIPDSVHTIEAGAFYGCTKLKNISIPSSVRIIEANVFEESGLNSIVIPDTVELFAYSVFRFCKNLISATLPDSFKAINKATFQGCSSLSSITIPKSVEVIGSGAFQDCSSLTHVIIPKSVKKIDSWAFEGCSNLKMVKLENSNTKYRKRWNPYTRSFPKGARIMKGESATWDSES